MFSFNYYLFCIYRYMLVLSSYICFPSRDEETGMTPPVNLLLAGTAAGLLAASTTTPADVVKTRL